MRELQARMTSLEFAYWLAFYRLEPFGEERADLRAGIVASTVANTARDKKRRRRPFTPDEFMPRYGERELPTQEQLMMKWRHVVMAAAAQRKVNGGS